MAPAISSEAIIQSSPDGRTGAPPLREHCLHGRRRRRRDQLGSDHHAAPRNDRIARSSQTPRPARTGRAGRESPRAVWARIADR